MITVGDQANTYLAEAATLKGCRVIKCRNALEAGAEAHQLMEEGAVLLFKGSQGGIYLEEAVKMVLHSTDDEDRLVRQSTKWMEKKRAFFETFQ